MLIFSFMQLRNMINIFVVVFCFLLFCFKAFLINLKSEENFSEISFYASLAHIQIPLIYKFTVLFSPQHLFTSTYWITNYYFVTASPNY